MNLNQLLYFVETSKCHSINEAAKKLYISQPSLSASLKAFENEIGFPLFYRNRQGVSLTSRGTQVLADCKQILSLTNHWQDLKLSGDGIRIEGAGIVASQVLPALLSSFSSKFPDLRLSLGQFHDFPILQPPDSSELHIVLALCEDDELSKLNVLAKANHWISHPLFCEQAYVFINTRNALASQNVLHLADFSDLEIAAFDAVHMDFYPYRSLYSYFPAERQIHLPNREAALCSIAASPDLIGLFPYFVTRENPYILKGELRAMRIEDFPMPITLTAFFSEDGDSLLIQHILETIEQTLTKKYHDVCPIEKMSGM